MITVPGHEGNRVLFRLVSLELPIGERERLAGLLTADELRRSERLLDRAKGDQFLVGRGVLREVLGELTGEEPVRIRLGEGEFGKPFLKEQAGEVPISFNLSHAGGYLLLAVGFAAEVGVDLEQVRQDLDFAPMARRYFSPREQEEIFSLAPEEQLAAFYRCWTRKEAYLKGTGTGFSQPCTSFDMSLLPGQPPGLLAHRGSPAEVDRWRIHDLSAPHGYCAAVAIRTPAHL